MTKESLKTAVNDVYFPDGLTNIPELLRTMREEVRWLDIKPTICA